MNLGAAGNFGEGTSNLIREVVQEKQRVNRRGKNSGSNIKRCVVGVVDKHGWGEKKLRI